MESKAFLAVGEEATRGAKESTTVGHIPLNNFQLPKPDFMARKRGEFRGERALLGHTTELRMGQKWDGLSLEMPAFSEAGTVTGMFGTVLKHFFGHAASAQNGATGQYYHMMSPVEDMFGAANLGAKALTLNMNIMEGNVLRNYPYAGGRVKKLTFKQEAGSPLLVTAECMGQKLDAVTAGLSDPVFATEEKRFDYDNLTIRTGAVTRTGTAPDYTDLTSSGTVIKPESVTVELERGMEDKLRLDGAGVPTRTHIGVLTGKVTMVLDWEDPASGFSSVDELAAWLAAGSSLSLLLTWDSGTQVGTGDNHSLILDLPVCNRLGGMPELSLEKDPMITMEFDLHYSETTKYAVGVLLKNSALNV
ncbi:MAG: phage tail tube protein [Deltaproteobacteria bacterium]|nr:phage tail tube protein [Deltaproteobacteria bacterium]